MTSSRLVRAALTETINAYRDMPQRPEDLPALASRLDDVRRANVEHHVGLVAKAKAQGVQVICFGELFPGPYFALRHDPMWTALAEDAATGKTVTTLREVAKANAMIIIAPIYELAPSGRRYNTAVVIDATGEVLGTYRKTHIPHGANEQGSFLEGHYYDRSDGGNTLGAHNVSKNPFFPVWQTSLGRLGVAICYDRHFEGVMWSLANAGAELIFCPAVTFGAKSQRMWHLEFQVDAARHNVFIGGSNRKGTEAPWGQPYFGESHFTGPNGLATNVSTHPELIIADLDLGELARPDPSGWNLPRDLRPDIYSPRR
ncbi:MAG: nitrilase-related carbon-nitrogen hydrolase [Myxococcales bacterium]|nr:nitrilase-related carbon-nitrogen hydrolase [Myxococcales bacterium]